MTFCLTSSELSEQSVTCGKKITMTDDVMMVQGL